jgi:cold-inducible RNA-binding protein
VGLPGVTRGGRRAALRQDSLRFVSRFAGLFRLERAAFFPEESHVSKKLYVGNLEFSVTDADLSKLFEPHGVVQSAQVIMDRDTGRSKGFGFVEMQNDQEAAAAIAALNGKSSGGRALTVNEARPKTEGARGGSSRGGYGGNRRY